jgi:hypothetical protein
MEMLREDHHLAVRDQPVIQRARTTPVRRVHLDLPPEIARAIEITAAQAGLSPSNLMTDILLDIFEPVFAGIGELAMRGDK